ncbi:hypothetical protein HRbin02_01731 [Candidatus Calditenuaceae archaeon HR02]|nr:hypothetical protein HRbin02_01731 [Candidatus Calditenuaceae archaeon HR02]
MSGLREYLDKRIRELEHELEVLRRIREILEEREKVSRGGGEGLDSLPWRPYRDGSGEWIFEDEAPETLISTIIAGRGRAVIDGYIYDLSSGRGGRRFVRRRPEKK